MAARCAMILSILALVGSGWGASFSDSRNSSSSEDSVGVTPAPNIHSIIQGLQKEPSGVAPNVVSPPGGAAPTFSGQGVSAGYSSGFRGAAPGAPVGIPPDAGLPPPIPGLGPAPGLGGYPGIPAPGLGGYRGLPAPGFGGYPGLGLGGLGLGGLLPGIGLGGLLPGLGLGGPPFGGPLDAGIGGPGIGGGISSGGYFPIVEKIIIVVGLGLLFLVIVALINGALAGAGWLAQDWGFGGIGGIGGGFSKGGHLDASINTPLGSASVQNGANIELADRVNTAVNAKF